MSIESLGPYNIADELNRLWSGPYNGVTIDLRNVLTTLGQTYDLGIYDMNDQAHLIGSVGKNNSHLEGRAADIDTINRVRNYSWYVAPKEWVQFSVFALQNNSNVVIRTYPALADAIKAVDPSLAPRVDDTDVPKHGSTAPHIHLEVNADHGADILRQSGIDPNATPTISKLPGVSLAGSWHSIFDPAFWTNFAVGSAFIALGIALITGGFVWLAAPSAASGAKFVAKNPEVLA